MDNLIAHPARNLVRVAVFMLVIWAASTLGYAEAGWSLPDALEARAEGAFFIVQLSRRNGDTITGPDKGTRIEPGDGVVAVGRSGQAISALFAARDKVRAGRVTF